MKITAHILVKNEENFIWYSIMSVINYVDEILVWDTGSTDNTLKIINQIKNPKIILKKIKVNRFHEDVIRQKMLDETTCDWFIVLDADEIWWSDSIRNLIAEINKNNNDIESIVVPTINMVGDIFHYQEDQAGRYHLAGKVGHYNLRAINRKIPGIHGHGEHGVFMWADDKNKRIEWRDQNKIKFLNAPYLHATHLKRTADVLNNNLVYKRAKKLKYEVGTEVSLDYYYPEVFFKTRPVIVKSPWQTPNLKYKFIAMIETPFKKIRRRYLMKGVKHGY